MDVAVINTGGTISCVGEPLAPMTAAAFAAACQSIIDPILAQAFPDLTVHYVTDLTFPESRTGTLDSTNLQPSDWCLIAGYILEHYAAYDGWVVLHGTDSLSFTGTALPFLLSCFDTDGVGTALLSKPVVITGAQVPLFYQAPGASSLTLNFDTDAFQNVCGAIAAAQSGIPEVCVYFDSWLYRGCRVMKTNASEFAAFSSPNYPALGQSGVAFRLAAANVLAPPVHGSVSLDDPTALAAATAQLAAITSAIDSVPVMQLNAFPAWYSTTSASALLADLIGACVGQGVRGLVLEAYGEGNFPSGNPDTPPSGAIYQALAAANAAGVVIVDNTQVLRGLVNNSAYASGAWLPAVGALSPVDMTPVASLAKLTVLLAAAAHQGWSNADVKRLMQLSLLGEMVDVSRLDSRAAAVLLPGQMLTTLDGSAWLLNDPVLGPTLSGGGTLLWSALAAPASVRMPGRLIMQNDGNLVFYDRENAAQWATNTGDPAGASSMLVLAGSLADQSLSLFVYDYSDGGVSATLYSQSNAARSPRASARFPSQSEKDLA